MAPEQIRGEPADRRSDIFAFGILLYEVLSGTHPFISRRIDATFAAILSEPVATLPPQLPAIPPALDALVARLLAKDPAARPQSFGDVRSALRRLSVDVVRPQARSRRQAVVDQPTADDQRHTDRTRARARAAAAEPQSGEVRPRQPHPAARRRGHRQNSPRRRRAGTARRRSAAQTLVGRCYEQEGTPALDPVHRSARRGLSADAAAAFRQAIGASAPELAKLMPELHRLFPDMPPPLELPPELRQRFLFTNVREFLTRCSRFMPLVDLHRRPAVGGRVDAAVDAAPGAAAREPPDPHHRGIPRGGGPPLPPARAGFSICSTGSAVSRATSSRRRPSRPRSISSSASGTPARSRCARSRKPTCRACSHRSAQPNPPARLVAEVRRSHRRQSVLRRRAVPAFEGRRTAVRRTQRVDARPSTSTMSSSLTRCASCWSAGCSACRPRRRTC